MDFISKKTGLTLTANKNDQIKDKETKGQQNFDFSRINFCSTIPFVIHCGENASTGINQLIPWIPVFSESGNNFLILVRNIELFKLLEKKYPWLHIAYAKRVVDIDALFKQLPETITVFYPSSTGNNIHLVRLNHLNHIFIGHGDSDKAASAHKALRLYDEIWTAGQAHIDRFKKSEFYTGHMKFLKVGRPNLQKILNNSDNLNGKAHILYLPTWEGIVEEANYSSTHISGQIIKAITNCNENILTIKYHPLTGSRNNILKPIFEMSNQLIISENLNANILNPSFEVSQAILKNNIFICDISGVVTECLAANCPIFVYIPLDKSISIAESEMSYSDYCYTYSSVKELTEKLIDVMSGNDYLAENRKNAIDYFIGYNETIENRFIQQLNSLSNNNQPRYIPRLFQEL